MTRRSFNDHRDYALAQLGLDELEADEYARRKVAEHDSDRDRRRIEKTGQLELENPPRKAFGLDKPPDGQIGPDDPWPDGFY